MKAIHVELPDKLAGEIEAYDTSRDGRGAPRRGAPAKACRLATATQEGSWKTS